MITLGLLFCLLFGGMAQMQQLSAASFKKDQLTIIASGEEHIINIEIAETNYQKALGLMYRTKLGAYEGMLFPYDRPQELSMWMKNTYIPLDMVFIKAGGVIHRIVANTEPHSEVAITSKGDVIAVLELAGGRAAELGVKKGDKVVHGLLNVRMP